jgi:periplasmic copper chaperone A
MLRTFFLAAALVLASAAGAQEYQLGALKIEQPWARATPQGAKVAAGYMKITNTGNAPDRFVGGTAAFSGGFELHEMKIDGGVMKMRALPNGVEIKPGETIEFKPGSYHVMFTGVKQALAAGQKVNGTLVFEKAGRVDVQFAVQPVGAPGPHAKGMPTH